MRPRPHDPPPARPGDLPDATAAGVALRAAAGRRFQRRSLASLAVTVAVAAAYAVAREAVQDDAPPTWAVGSAALLVWLLVSAMLWGLSRADSADAGDLRAATILHAGARGVTVRDAAGAVWRWRVRWGRDGRRPAPGERAWITGRGDVKQPPHMVLSGALAPGRHVAWAAPEHGVRRLPSDETDVAPAVGQVVDPDDPIS